MSPHNFVDFQKVSYTKRILWVASEDIRSHSVTCSKSAPDKHDQGYWKTFRDFGLKDFFRTQLALSLQEAFQYCYNPKGECLL